MELKFVESESAFAYFAATREYLERHGKPVAFYSDKASVFRINQPRAVGSEAQPLQPPPLDRVALGHAQMFVLVLHGNTISQLLCCTSFLTPLCLLLL
jgi:hypothetical protein